MLAGALWLMNTCPPFSRSQALASRSRSVSNPIWGRTWSSARTPSGEVYASTTCSAWGGIRLTALYSGAGTSSRAATSAHKRPRVSSAAPMIHPAVTAVPAIRINSSIIPSPPADSRR